jgi:hypothetical protein
MKIAISGTRNGQDWPPAGGTIDLPDNEATQLITAGIAADPSADEQEVAVGESPETATAPDTAEKRGRGRPRKQE